MDQAGKELALCLLDSLLKSKGQGSADNPSTPEDLQPTAEVAAILCQKTVDVL